MVNDLLNECYMPFSIRQWVWLIVGISIIDKYPLSMIDDLESQIAYFDHLPGRDGSCVSPISVSR
jgi:hypothetical protein